MSSTSGNGNAADGFRNKCNNLRDSTEDAHTSVRKVAQGLDDFADGLDLCLEVARSPPLAHGFVTGSIGRGHQFDLEAVRIGEISRIMAGLNACRNATGIRIPIGEQRDPALVDGGPVGLIEFFP